MAKIIFFSKVIAYNMGGAERSMLSLAKEMSASGDEIIFVSLPRAKANEHNAQLLSMPPHWQVNYINSCVHLRKFPYLEYFINRRRISKYFASIAGDELHTYGVLAPAAQLGFSGPITYYLRSFSDLGCLVNNFNGIKRILKYAYFAIEWIPFSIYRSDLKKTISNANVIANSKYMASKLKLMYNKSAILAYPIIDVEEFRNKVTSTGGKSIVFVGDNVGKGLDLVLRLSKILVDYEFRIHSRKIEYKSHEANVSWVPWSNDVSLIYTGASLVIVPSQWEEAYGRVAREAYLLNIPVLVSSVGGLPEAVDYNDELIVKDYRSTSAWAAAIISFFNRRNANI